MDMSIHYGFQNFVHATPEGGVDIGARPMSPKENSTLGSVLCMATKRNRHAVTHPSTPSRLMSAGPSAMI